MKTLKKSKTKNEIFQTKTKMKCKKKVKRHKILKR